MLTRRGECRNAYRVRKCVWTGVSSYIHVHIYIYCRIVFRRCSGVRGRCFSFGRALRTIEAVFLSGLLQLLLFVTHSLTHSLTHLVLSSSHTRTKWHCTDTLLFITRLLLFIALFLQFKQLTLHCLTASPPHLIH